MAKINIHFTLDAQTREYCRTINTEIRKLTNSIIIFDDNSPMIPHISLVMGELDPNYTIEHIASTIRNVSGYLKPMTFCVLSPYLETVRNRYIFSDIDTDTAFSSLKRQFHDLLNPKYVLAQNDYTEVPHITLGHVEEKQEKVREYLASVKTDFTFTSEHIEISEVGLKGTCINSLFLYRLSKI